MTNNTEAKQKIIILGATGLLGSRVHELLSDTFEIERYGVSNGVDITKPETLDPISSSKATHVLHFAAKADVDGCEKDKPLGKDGPAWKLNVDGPRFVSQMCERTNKTMMYVSTDFVFNGEKKPPYEYSEEDTPDPLNWYAMTKFEGERAVIKTGVRSVIIRTAYPYRKSFETKKDFVRVILGRLKNHEQVKAVTDHFMSPTFIDDIASAFRVLISKNQTGLFHVAGTGSVTPFEAALMIAKEFGLDESLISKTTRAEFFKDRATRPFNLALKNDKITSLGVSMSSFNEGLTHVH